MTGGGFWDESFWLPEGVSWTDMKSNSTMTYPEVSDLKYTLVGGVALLVLRVFLETFVFLPIGWLGGWIQGSLFSRMAVHITGGFAGKSKFKRVAECAFRLLFYIAAWTAGAYLLWDSPQLNDISDCWRHWPHHHVNDGIWWYYIVETSFYWALLFATVFIDIRRADFVQMTVHHAITILLLYISWSMNMVRVGTLVLFSHDAADIFIDMIKLARYAAWQSSVTVMFLVFLAVWIGTRLVYYPFWIMQSIWFDAPDLVQKSYQWSNIWQRPLVPRVLMIMLSTLLVLHVFWTYLILKVAYQSVRGGDIDDVREEDSDSEEESEKKKQ